jgi:hypothetical protein
MCFPAEVGFFESFDLRRSFLKTRRCSGFLALTVGHNCTLHLTTSSERSFAVPRDFFRVNVCPVETAQLPTFHIFLLLNVQPLNHSHTACGGFPHPSVKPSPPPRASVHCDGSLLAAHIILLIEYQGRRGFALGIESLD